MIRKTLILVAAGAAAWLASAGAMAAGSDDTRSVRVSYADLDLSKAAGVDSLRSRLRQASEKVCGGSSDIRDLGTSAAQRQCSARALSAALEQLRTAQHAARVAAGSTTAVASNSR